MSDSIDRQAAIETVDFECGEWRGLAGTIINGLKNLPAVDAISVVRCRDCVHNELPPTAGNALCSIYSGMTEVYGFCHREKGGKKMRLIDADALAELLKREAEHHEADGLLERSYGVLDAYMDVLQAPTVPPEPPKMGRWEMKPDPFGFFDEIPVCSECGCTTKMREKTKYCPNCGARMEEEDETD